MANANDTIVQIEDDGGTLRTLTCDFNSVRYRRGKPVNETETFCATSKSTGNMNGSFTLAGLFSGETNRVDDVFDGRLREGTARLYKYFPAGSGSGAVVYSGLAFLSDYELGGDAGGQVDINADFAIDGDDFRSTV